MKRRRISNWSAITAAMTLILLSLAANAQMGGGEKGKRHRDTQKTEDPAKKKADEKAYQDALKNIPASNEKADPWKRMR